MSSDSVQDEAAERKRLAHQLVRHQKFAVIPVHYDRRADPAAGVPTCSCKEGAKCPAVGKHPMVFGWTENNVARSGPDVEEFWTLYPGANPGIVTGAASNDGTGDLVVIDVDVDKGGAESYERLMQPAPGEVLRLVPPTRRTQTGGGGFHVFYRLPAGVHLKSRPLDHKRYPGIDVRADRGMVISFGARSGKGTYRTDDAIEDKVGRIPGWLLEILQDRQKDSVDAVESAERSYALPETIEVESLPPALRDKLTGPPLVKGEDVDRSDVFHNLVCDLWEAGCTEGQAVFVLTPWCARNEPPMYPGRVAVEVHRVWAKRETKQRNAEFDLTGIYNPSALAHQPHEQAFTMPKTLDPERVAETRALLERPVESAENGIDFERVRSYLGDLDQVAALIAGFDVIDWEHLLSTPPPPPDWILPEVMERGQFVCIYAPEGHGKSLVMQQQMGAAVAGRIVSCGELMAPATVLYLDLENNARDLLSRYSAGGFKHEELARLRYIFADGLPYLHTPAGARALFALIAEHRPDVVVLDTFARFVEGEQNAPEAPNAFFRLVAKPLTDAGITVVVLDHTAKDRTIRGPIGSRAKTATPHLVWRMEKQDDDPDTLLFTLEKDRRGNCPPYLRVHKKSLPLDFDFEPLTKEEYDQERAMGRLGGEPQKKRGRPRKDDDEKIDALVEKLDAAGVRVEATWGEAAAALHAADLSFDRSYLKRALRRRTGTEWDDE